MKKDRSLIIAAMITALFVVFTAFLHIPYINGYIHIGDAVLFTGAFLLPPPLAIAAAALGGALADLVSGYPVYALASAVIKSLMVLPLSLGKKKFFSLFGVLINVGGYFVFDAVLYGFEAALTAAAGDFVQSALSCVVFFVFARYISGRAEV